MSGLAKFVVGAVIGAAAVALFTPYTGMELRERIREILKRKGLVADEHLDEVVEMIAAEINRQ